MIVLNSTDVIHHYTCYQFCHKPFMLLFTMAHGQVRYVVDVLNATDKSFLFQLIYSVQLQYENMHNTQMVMHFTASAGDVSSAR